MSFARRKKRFKRLMGEKVLLYRDGEVVAEYEVKQNVIIPKCISCGNVDSVIWTRTEMYSWEIESRVEYECVKCETTWVDYFNEAIRSCHANE